MGPMLESLFRQTVFDRMAARRQRCEVLVLAAACADRTAAVAREVFERMAREHPLAGAWSAQVIELEEAGRDRTWNRFVHEFSAVEATYLVTLHPAILLHHRDALFSLVSVLERRRHVNAASGRRCADVLFKERKTFRERLALASVRSDSGSFGQVNGELMCLRASVARRIHVPGGLDAGFDDFVTQVVGTDFFSTRFDPTRLASPPCAAHICAAQIGAREILESRKRRMIGQTAAHVLSGYLRSRSWSERHHLLDTLRSHEAMDPQWLDKLIANHVRRRSVFSRLCPGILRIRSSPLPLWRKIRQIPEACGGYLLNVIAYLRASRSLRMQSAGRQPASEVVLPDGRPLR